tara:strand:- start:1320 stop:2570 length:1251 start_codon:yes stop_codon:yes gene_type:complete
MSYFSILEQAIETNEKIQKKEKKKIIQNEIIEILEEFIKTNGLVCYGGIAINSILPKAKKFYDERLDIPDYDCFSPDALNHAKELALIYAKAGYQNVESKSAVFFGTYKVFVNFIPIADITNLEVDVFNLIQNKSIMIKNILYSPPSYLRMSLYQELSRPYGDVSRWYKIYKRLTLLNDTHPFEYEVDLTQNNMISNDENISFYNKLVKLCIKNKYVLFGDFGLSFYKEYFPNKQEKIIDSKEIKQIYILTDKYQDIIDNITLLNIPFKLISHTKDYKFINSFYEIEINGQSLLYIFTTNSCQSYNKIKVKGNYYNIASIDTILSIYHAIEYLNESSINIVNILSYCYLLASIHSNNKTNVLKRFYLPCIGHQNTIEDIRKERDEKYIKYRKNKQSLEYKKWFFKYYPKTKKSIKK